MENQVAERVGRLLGDGQDNGEFPPEQLTPLLYEELKDLARQYMRGERKDHTLQPTALVHEAYLRLCMGETAHWAGRTHFFNAAAKAMRRILIEHARAHGQLKRGGALKRLPMEAMDLACDEQAGDLLEVDGAITRLEELSPSVAAVVRLRFYAGMTQPETAQVLGISERTVRREWIYGRAWLMRALSDASAG